MSMAIVSRIGLPLFSDSTIARCSLLASITSAILSRMSALFAGSTFFQLFQASHAVVTARSTSSRVASAHSASTFPLAGQWALKYLPSLAGRHSPLINNPYCFCSSGSLLSIRNAPLIFSVSGSNSKAPLFTGRNILFSEYSF
ncbi:hypothetical protein SDC9_199385 [bioreactor metagenome]|uniref:Uncharacterized protein n=1 Tax=bioreactor metagenome TaxID=1076179 RepID=A0A645IL40_9ZZZZ